MTLVMTWKSFPPPPPPPHTHTHTHTHPPHPPPHPPPPTPTPLCERNLPLPMDYGHKIPHYNDVIMSAMASQITSITMVYSTVYSGADQRKHQSPASLAFVGIHRWPVNSPHKGPVTRKVVPFVTSSYQWCGALIFSLLLAWTNFLTNNRAAGELRRDGRHVTSLKLKCILVVLFPGCLVDVIDVINWLIDWLIFSAQVMWWSGIVILRNGFILWNR